MNITSFRQAKSTHPIHTPDALLNVFLACRVPHKRASPGLLSMILQRMFCGWPKVGHRAGKASHSAFHFP